MGVRQWQSQDHRQGLRALSRKAMECVNSDRSIDHVISKEKVCFLGEIECGKPIIIYYSLLYNNLILFQSYLDAIVSILDYLKM
jgi:hypothetical protein